MSKENIEVVRRKLEAHNVEDTQGFLDQWDPECEWFTVTGSQIDRLVLEERAEALGSELAPDTGFLVAAEGSSELDPVVVQRQGAGAYLTGNPHRPVHVAAPHASGQAVLRIVGDTDGV